jgi:ABC-type phosphate transport system substrate-binding protein
VNSDVYMYNMVSGTPNSIGYVEYTSDVPSAQIVQIINRAGAKVGPSWQSFSAASADFVDLPSLHYDPTTSLTGDIVDGKGLSSWPFSGFYYIIVHTKNSDDCTKTGKLYSFLNWMVSSSSSRLTATSYLYFGLLLNHQSNNINHIL